MSGRAKRALALATTGAVALAAAPAPAGSAPVDARTPKPRRVEVADNFYGPPKLTVKVGTKIVWRWTEESADIHDVKLVSAPKGFRRFRSEPATAGFRYAKTLTRPGTYRLVCTLHIADDMRMTIKVRR
jgi:plastocyanin